MSLLFGGLVCPFEKFLYVLESQFLVHINQQLHYSFHRLIYLQAYLRTSQWDNQILVS